MLRQGRGFAVQHVVDAQKFGGAHHAALDLVLGGLAQAQAEGHVFVQRLVRVQGVVLKHHGDVPVAGRLIVDALAVNDHVTAADALEPRNHAQQRAFAATRRAHEHNEFAVLYLQVNAVNDGRLAVLGFADLFEFNTGHINTPAREL